MVFSPFGDPTPTHVNLEPMTHQLFSALLRVADPRDCPGKGNAFNKPFYMYNAMIPRCRDENSSKNKQKSACKEVCLQTSDKECDK
jgi:hypothetical protein